MKILNITQYLNEGFGYHENIFHYYQKKLGHETLILTSNVQNLIQGERHILPVGVYEEKGVKVIRLRVKFNFLNRMLFLENMMEEIEKFKPDIIYCHTINLANMMEIIKYKQKHKCKIYVDNHADWDNSARNFIWKVVYYNIFLKLFYKLYGQYIDKFFGVTYYRIDFLKKEIGIKEENIDFLPMGYDNEIVDKTEKKADFFEDEYNLPIQQEDIKIIFGGKMDKNKLFSNVVKAVKNIRKNNMNNIKIIIIGRIQDEELKKLITENKKWVFFLGWKTGYEKYQILKNCDLAVWPRHHTTLIEDCIGVGLPILVFKNRNMEHLLYGNNGMYLEISSVEEIENKLKYMLNPIVLNNYKDNAEKFKSQMGYEGITKMFLNKIEKLDY